MPEGRTPTVPPALPRGTGRNLHIYPGALSAFLGRGVRASYRAARDAGVEIQLAAGRFGGTTNQLPPTP